MTDPLLRLPAVIKETGRSRSSIYEDMDKGAFPRPVRIGKRAVAWRQSVIEKWKSEREIALE